MSISEASKWCDVIKIVKVPFPKTVAQGNFVDFPLQEAGSEPAAVGRVEDLHFGGLEEDRMGHDDPRYGVAHLDFLVVLSATRILKRYQWRQGRGSRKNSLGQSESLVQQRVADERDLYAAVRQNRHLARRTFHFQQVLMG